MELVKPNMVPITTQLINRGRSSNGGLSRRQVELLGGTWPPKPGWLGNVLNRQITQEDADEFLALVNTHLTQPRQRRRLPDKLARLEARVASLEATMEQVVHLLKQAQ